MQLRRSAVALLAKHGAREKLIYAVADMRKAKHTDRVDLSGAHMRAKIVHVSSMRVIRTR